MPGSALSPQVAVQEVAASEVQHNTQRQVEQTAATGMGTDEAVERAEHCGTWLGVVPDIEEAPNVEPRRRRGSMQEEASSALPEPEPEPDLDLDPRLLATNSLWQIEKRTAAQTQPASSIWPLDSSGADRGSPLARPLLVESTAFNSEQDQELEVAINFDEEFGDLGKNVVLELSGAEVTSIVEDARYRGRLEARRERDVRLADAKRQREVERLHERELSAMRSDLAVQRSQLETRAEVVAATATARAKELIAEEVTHRERLLRQKAEAEVLAARKAELTGQQERLRQEEQRMAIEAAQERERLQLKAELTQMKQALAARAVVENKRLRNLAAQRIQAAARLRHAHKRRYAVLARRALLVKRVLWRQ